MRATGPTAIATCLAVLAIGLPAMADDVDDFVENRDKALALGPEGRALFTKTAEGFSASLDAMTTSVDAFYDTAQRQPLGPDEGAALQKLEFRRDLGEFLLAEAYATFARTFAEGDAARENYAEQALERYDDFTQDRGSASLLLQAYLDRGELLIRLKRTEEAIEEYQELVHAEPGFLPNDPEQRKAVTDGVLDVVIRAYYGWTRALLAEGRAQAACEAASGIDTNPRAEGWSDRPAGFLLTLERSKALAASGHGPKAARRIYGVINRAKYTQGAPKIEGSTMNRLEAAACRALSELSELTGGELYAPEIQFYVGVGHFLRGQTALAIAAYKGVLTTARTRRERREWIPKTVKEFGALLFREERFLESALAFQTAFTEFPEHEATADAERFAISASKRAVAQFGEHATDLSTPIARFARELEESIATDCGFTRNRLLLKEAIALHRKRSWLEAAAKYSEILPETLSNTGKLVKVTVYANARANAGYCTYKAYQKDKRPGHLEAARVLLDDAATVASATGDLESQALASYYLGRLENGVDRPISALAALSPFEGRLNKTTFAVRARHQQAEAHLARGDVEQAEGCFEAIEKRTSDVGYGAFAYSMASAMRSQARNVRTAEPTALDARRYLNRRAAAYVGLWTQSIRLETYRASVLRWAANTLFVGGNYAAAFEAYELAIAKTERPSPDTPAGLRANKRLDVAELEAAYCLLMLGENERALERFKTLEQIGYAFTVRARRRHAVMRCLMTGRSLSQDAFTFRRAGRNYARKCWFLAFDVDGEKRVFFETRAPRGGSQFTGVQGTDPTQPFTPSTDEYEIDLTLRGHYLLVDGMAKATWAVWGKTADRSFLANEVTSASNALIVTLRGLEGRYTALVSGNQLKPTQFVARRWQARLQFLEIKMARQDYRGVVSEIRLFELRGEFETASPTVRAKVESLRRTAEARAPGK